LPKLKYLNAGNKLAKEEHTNISIKQLELYIRGCYDSNMPIEEVRLSTDNNGKDESKLIKKDL
jgi:hypothetical protein